MELTHRFTVPAPVEETWATFNDIEGVAGCFPGATVTSVEGDTFQGSCKVKLGPIALVYNGSGTFLDKDEPNHSMKIEAKGKDKRGNGTAGANVSATMTANGDSTDVVVVTDLAITGKPAQFGRGVMQDVSDKLLGQFVACVEKKLGGGDQEGGRARCCCNCSAPAAAPASMAPAETADAGRDVGACRANGRGGSGATEPRTEDDAPTRPAGNRGRRRPRPGRDRPPDPREDVLEAGPRRAPGTRLRDQGAAQRS